MRTPPRIVVSFCFIWLALTGRAGAAESATIAADAVNALGLDLLRQSADKNANFLLSPYSIQSALAMTYAGAAGSTQTEMAKALHYPSDEAALHASFAALRANLAAASEKAQASAAAVQAKLEKSSGGPRKPLSAGEKYVYDVNGTDVEGNPEPFILETASRLYGPATVDFRAPYLSLLKDSYDAPLERLDFARNPGAAVATINSWIARQTHNHFVDLLSARDVDSGAALLLVNAVYLKAPWTEPFSEIGTQPRPFRLGRDRTVDVPTMVRGKDMTFAQEEGFSVVTIPLIGDLQFVVFLPDAVDGLPALEKKLTPEALSAATHLPDADIVLFLPRLHLTPDLIELVPALQALGMKRAFAANQSNFDRMAATPLKISGVLHKTFLNLDEKGVEAAAATVVIMGFGAGARMTPPPEIHVDHPFLFAIQHRPSGACLFLGRVTDPRQ